MCARGSASAGTHTLLVSEGRYFLLPASFLVVSPLSCVLASYVLQHEWKPTIVLDLSLKSKVLWASEAAAWGNPHLCTDATVEFCASKRVAHVAECT